MSREQVKPLSEIEKGACCMYSTRDNDEDLPTIANSLPAPLTNSILPEKHGEGRAAVYISSDEKRNE